jgi:hypothetical protein
MDLAFFLHAARYMPEREIVRRIADATLAYSRKPGEETLLDLKLYCHLLMLNGLTKDRTDAEILAEFEQIRNVRNIFNKN